MTLFHLTGIEPRGNRHVQKQRMDNPKAGWSLSDCFLFVLQNRGAKMENFST